MKLFDKVASATGPLTVLHPQIGQVHLPGASQSADQVADIAARYILMDDLTRACGAMVLDQPELLGDCIDFVRLPTSAFWVEWTNRRLNAMGPGPHPDPAQREGVLISSDDSGRRGTMQSFWDGPDGSADRCPALLRFDFDGAGLGPSPTDCHPALGNLFGRTEIVVDPQWLRYYAIASPDHITHKLAMDDICRTLWRDFAVVYAFSLMMSLRNELTIAPSDLERLNRSRHKNGKSALLDYLEVGARVFAPQATEMHGEIGEAHHGARLHHVRGHFVRRDQKIFWRRTHLRGDPSVGVAPVRVARMALGRQPPPPQRHHQAAREFAAAE